MRKILIIILLAFSLTAWGTKYYVDAAGNDGTGDGSSGNPWALVSYACTQATTAGDTIYVNAGNYTETARINVSRGVHLLGDSTNMPTVTSTYVNASYYAVWLADETLQNGNQSISYINFNGSNFTAYGGIMVWNRSNVDIHHCTFTNFHLWGVRFYVANSEGELSPNYATGNSFRHNTVTNCAGYSSYGFGGCGIDGQEDFYIGYNDFTQKNTPGTNGMPIKAAVNGIIRNGKIEHNNIYMNPFTSSEHWDFAIELWDCRGGVEIAYNYCEGSLDIGGRSNLRGVYAADNYNGIALYRLTGGTSLSKVTETANNGDLWKGASYSLQTIPFTSAQTLTPGVYYVVGLYNSSSQTTAPNIYCWNYLGAINSSLTGTNGNRIAGTLASQTSLPSTISANTLSSSEVVYGFWLY